MKLLLPALLVSGLAAAQTTLIAHKSHSGTASTFAFADPGNFGLSERLVKVKKISDTSVVLTNLYGSDESNDTIYGHPIFSDPNISVDSMQQLYYYENVNFENFQQPKAAQRDTVRTGSQPLERQKNSQRDHQKMPPKKKKQSNLFWLWIIGGGTFGGILLISRRRKPRMIPA